MQAIVHNRYGGSEVLECKEISLVPAPKPHQLLIRVHAASLAAGDLHLVSGTPYFIRLALGGLTAPRTNRIIGNDLSGEVIARGSQCQQFQLGDAVITQLDFTQQTGACAQFVCVEENKCVLKPVTLTHEEAAALPVSSVTALQGLRDTAQVKAGQKVLIHGAAGGVGTYAIQIAKILGATVTAVCSTSKVQLARELGADQVLDYKEKDWIQYIHSQKETYDVVFDLIGNRSLAEYRSILTPQGTYVSAGGSVSTFWRRSFILLCSKVFTSQTLKMLMSSTTQHDLLTIKEYVDAKKLKPVVDKTFPLAQTQQAFKYLEEGHAAGKIVITIHQ